MTRPIAKWLMLGLLVTVTSGLAGAQESPSPSVVNSSPVQQSASPGPTPAAPAPTPESPKISPLAEKLLRRACSELSAADAFTFHAEIVFDQVLRHNVKLQFSGAADYAVQHPDGFAINYNSDLGAKDLWYDGQTLTIFDPPHMVYAVAPMPPTIDGMLASAAKYKLSIPLSDLAASDPCGISKDILFGVYVGVNDVEGTACDHLAFTEKSADWQIWLPHTGRPLPRKILINYRSQLGAPQWAAVLSDWKFPAEIPESKFHATIPGKAIRIEFKKPEETKP